MILQWVASLWRRFILWLRNHLFVLSTFFLLFVLILVFLWPRVFITIHSGEAGVLYRRLFDGTVLDRVYDEGFWVLWPWDLMTVYDIRVQAVKHEFTVLSADGLPIRLKLLIRFKPEHATLAVLHQRVGPNYVGKIVVPTVESVIRKSIGQFRQEDIYQTKKGILTKIVLLAIQEAGRKYIRMDDVIIRTIELPPPIRQAIENKLVHEQQLAAYEFRTNREKKEARRKEIEAEGIQKYQALIRETLDDTMLMWHGIQATNKLSQSHNSKVVIIGAGKRGLPLIGSLSLDNNSTPAVPNTTISTPSGPEKLLDVMVPDQQKPRPMDHDPTQPFDSTEKKTDSYKDSEPGDDLQRAVESPHPELKTATDHDFRTPPPSNTKPLSIHKP